MPTIETVLTDVQARLKSLPDHVTSEAAFEERARLIAKQVVDSMVGGGGDFARRFRPSASDSKLVGSKFARYGLNASDIEFLYDVQVAEQRAGRGRGPSADLEGAFKSISDAMYLSEDEIQKIDKRAIDNLFPRVPVSAFTGLDRDYAAKGMFDRTSLYRKAMDTAEAGYGDELTGATYVRDLWTAARMESRVFSMLPSFEMQDPLVYLPVEADLPEMLLFSEATSANPTANASTKTGSNRVAITAQKLGFTQYWSGELEEDALIPFVPFLRQQLAIATAHYMDSLVLNGDTVTTASTNINLIDGTPGATKHYLAFDGIRKIGLVDNTGNSKNINGTISWASLKDAQRRMRSDTYLQDWGHPTNPQDLVYVADPDTTDKIATLDEVLTVDKFGPNATVATGQQGRIGQHPLIASMALPKTDATGKVSGTAANNTKGQVVAFNRNGFRVGFRRRVRVETWRDVRTDQNVLALYVRVGLGRYSASGAASGIECADVSYNISL